MLGWSSWCSNIWWCRLCCFWYSRENVCFCYLCHWIGCCIVSEEKRENETPLLNQEHMYILSIALVIFLSDTISSLFPSLPRIIVSLISFLILTPMLFVPVRHLSYASLLGVLIAVSILFILLYDGFSKPDAPGSLIESAVSVCESINVDMSQG